MDATHEGTRTMRTLYPERRAMNEVEILQWAADLYIDSAPRNRCPVCGIVTVVVQHGRHAEVRPGEFLATDPNHPCQCVAGTVPGSPALG